MSKDKDKRKKMEMKMQQDWEKLQQWEYPNEEKIQMLCNTFKEEAINDCDGHSYIDFNAGEMNLPSGTYKFTEAVLLVNPKCADSTWHQSKEGDILDAGIYIGTIKNPFTCIPKTRVFRRFNVEETGETRFTELESFHIFTLVNRELENHDDAASNANVSYAMIAGFISGEMIELDFCEVPSINMIMEFISFISAALKANPKKRIIDMPKKEVLTEFMAKLTVVNNRDSLPSANGKNDFYGYYKRKMKNTKHSKQFKIDTIKYFKDKKQSIYRTAYELNIPYHLLYNWIKLYDKYGENAFLGSRMYQEPTSLITQEID